MKRTYGHQNGNTEDSRTKSDINSLTAYSIPHSSWIVKQLQTELALMFSTLSPTLYYALPTFNATLSMLDEVLEACFSALYHVPVFIDVIPLLQRFNWQKDKSVSLGW